MRPLAKPSKDDLEIVRANTLAAAAEFLGRSRETVRRWRMLYLPEHPVVLGRPRRPLPASLIAELGKVPDADIARRFDIPKNTVRNSRVLRDIETYAPPRGSAAVNEGEPA